jgi:flagellar motor switch protein FliG
MSTENNALLAPNAAPAETRPARGSQAQAPQVADSFGNFASAPENHSVDTAAAVLLALGKAHSGVILSNLNEVQIGQLVRGAEMLRTAERGMRRKALRAFVEAMEDDESARIASDVFMRELLESALGEDRIARLFSGSSKITLEEVGEDISTLASASPDDLARLFSEEPPQAVAVAISQLEKNHALSILQKMNPQRRTRIIEHLAFVENVSAEYLREVITGFAEDLRKSGISVESIDGEKMAVDLIRAFSIPDQQKVFAQMRDQQKVERLRSKVFMFDDVARLSMRDLQALMREIETKTLLVALKGSSPQVRTQILENMSSRQREAILDDLDAIGQVKASDIEKAQNDIARIAIRMIEQERISPPG